MSFGWLSGPVWECCRTHAERNRILWKNATLCEREVCYWNGICNQAEVSKIRFCVGYIKINGDENNDSNYNDKKYVV